MKFKLSKQIIALLLLLLFLALYAATKFVLFAYAILIALLAAVLLDFDQPSSGKQSTEKTVREIAIALVAAVGFWFALGFILQTATPINVITSCSMLPVMDRGDLIILQGGAVKVPETTTSMALAGAVYENFSLADPYSGRVNFLTFPFVNGQPVFGSTFKECHQESVGLACLDAVELNNESYRVDYGNDVIVYAPHPSWPGLIIHRAFLKINAADGVYYVTKGDNNKFLDQQSAIEFVRSQDVQGKVLLRVPYLGYLKLFLFLQFDEPEQCRYPPLQS
jgi:signal peptidase I